jgi:hypothetical protein
LIKQRIDEVVKKKNEIPSGMPHGRKNAEGMSYFDIGMIPPYFCWRWSLKDKKILVGKDECHFKHFGKDAYESFRGRYDPQTKKLSITIPDFPKKLITGDLKKDVPLEILKGIKTAFPGCKIHYFPFRT